MDANGADFSDAVMDLAAARQAKLVGANLTSTSAIKMLGAGADFSAANASKAIFNGANLSGAIFNGALLTSASFIGSNLANASFHDARLAGADFSDATGALQENFIGACVSEMTRLPAGLVLQSCAE